MADRRPTPARPDTPTSRAYLLPFGRALESASGIEANLGVSKVTHDAEHGEIVFTLVAVGGNIQRRFRLVEVR